jgi:choline dehydrogenase-like flavoprotein
MPHLSIDEQWTLLRIAEVATPAGRSVPIADASTLAEVERFLDRIGKTAASAYRGLVHALDLAAIPLSGRRLSSLAPIDREAALVRLNRAESTYWMVRAVTLPIKMAQAQTAAVEDAFGIEDGRRLPIARERHRFEERIFDARALERDEEIEVDVVIVGTGAGGAPMAHALASNGHAVLMLEEGGYFTRADFSGRPLERQFRLYRELGLTMTIGNTMIPLPMGMTVGGSTTVNSGTCYRTPSSVMRRWQLEHGLHDLGPGALDPHFESVEAMLEVEPARDHVLGEVAHAIARGAEKLGYAHGPLSRNAPGCDGQATCCFGCPTDAKRSTNVSYVPRALEKGAMLYANARVERVIIEGGRAVGVTARATGVNGSARRITVRAKVVVLACGTVHTPALLLSQGIANSSDQVGRNLTIHPCGHSWALYDETIRGFEEIPQGYAVEEFADQGIRFEGGFPPLALAASTFLPVGRRWTDLVERFDRLVCFGFMTSESSRGRVVLGPGGSPQMTYWMNDEDVRRIVRAQAILARIYFASGAKAVFPGLQIFEELADEGDAERLEREGPDRLRAHHLDLSAYHPLGTCRMGSDPKRAVIGSTNESHDVQSLFIVDGSAVPGPLGVNPQITIMAISERAARYVERRIAEGPRATRVVKEGALVTFAETMSGLCSLEASEGGGSVDVTFKVRATGRASLLDALRKGGGTWALDGTIAIEGVLAETACEGTLVMRPLVRRATLVYDLVFARDGVSYTLHGEKHAGLLHPVRGMTTLYTELRKDGALLGRGVLTFDLKDLQPWLRSFARAS